MKGYEQVTTDEIQAITCGDAKMIGEAYDKFKAKNPRFVEWLKRGKRIGLACGENVYRKKLAGRGLRKFFIVLLTLSLSACGAVEVSPQAGPSASPGPVLDTESVMPHELHVVVTGEVVIKEFNPEWDDDQALYIRPREEERGLLYTIDLATCKPVYTPAREDTLEVEIPNHLIAGCFSDFWESAEVGTKVRIAGNLSYSTTTNGVEMNYQKWAQILDSEYNVVLDTKDCEKELLAE